MVRLGALLLLAVALLATTASCQRAGRATGPASAAPRPVPADVVEGRRRLRSHDTAGALAALGIDRPFGEATPERTWVLARILAERTEADRARGEAAALPRGPFRTALSESLAEDPEMALRRLQSVLAHRGSPWLHLAAAYLHQFRGDGPPARAHAALTRGSGSTFIEVEALLVEGRTWLLDGDPDRAEAAARQAMRLDATDTRAHDLAGEAARQRGEFDVAARVLLEAMGQIPRSRRYPRALTDVLRRAGSARLRQLAEASIGRRDDGTNPERLVLRGFLAESREAYDEAIGHYEAARALGADPIPAEAALRRLLIRRGDYAGGVALLFRAVPADVRNDPQNLWRAKWQALESAMRGAPHPAAGPGPRVALARALVGVGALPEAAAVLLGLRTQRARSLDERVARQRAFVDAFEAYVERGYRETDARRGGADFRSVLATLRRLARRHLDPAEACAFAEPERGARSIPLVGTWLDHSADTTSPVVGHFRRYGTFLMLGQRGDQPTEAILLSLASLTRDQEVRTRGGRYRQDVAIGYDRSSRPLAAAQGGDLGGACLPDGIWMDLDSVRSLESDLRQVVRLDVGLTQLARRRPRLVAADTTDGVFALTDAAGAGERLLLRYLDRCADDPWGSFRTLRAHEYGHLVEIRRHLPLFERLPATLALFARSRLSFAVVEQEVERLAQLAAVAESEDPDLALAEMLLLLPIPSRVPEPHDGGYLAALSLIVREVWRRPDVYPQVDRSYRVAPQLDRLSNEQIRRAARAALGRP